MTVPDLPSAVDYTWSLSPPVLLAVTLAGGVYALRLRDLRRAPAPRSGDTLRPRRAARRSRSPPGCW